MELAVEWDIRPHFVSLVRNELMVQIVRVGCCAQGARRSSSKRRLKPLGI